MTSVKRTRITRPVLGPLMWGWLARNVGGVVEPAPKPKPEPQPVGDEPGGLHS